MKALLLVFFVFCGYVASAQLSVASLDSTRSRCYNDGSITIQAAGGTGPYQYKIISGPTLPGVNYPLFPDNGGSFLSLHSGTYVVQITDNNGNTLNVTVSVPGNYQFPTQTATVVGDSIICNASLGKPPYQYTISSVGTNGPFAPYQTSNIFDSLCNGTYYLRVKDSCGNFFTTPGVVINRTPLILAGSSCFNTAGNDVVQVFVQTNTGFAPFTYHFSSGATQQTNTTGTFTLPANSTCFDTIRVTDICNGNQSLVVDCHPLFKTGWCSNFSDSSANLTFTGGKPPYTVTLSHYVNGQWQTIMTQDSGHFLHIPYAGLGDSIAVEVVDACGRKISKQIDTYLKVNLITNCPFDGEVRLDSYSGATLPITVQCLSCVPPRTATYSGANSNPIFTGMDTGWYHMLYTDACGEHRDTMVHFPTPLPIQAVMQPLSCNDVKVVAVSSDGDTLTGAYFVLSRYNSTTQSYDSIAWNTTGIFSDLPNGQYEVRAVYTECKDGKVNFGIPIMPAGCMLPFMDDNCNVKLKVRMYPNNGSDLAEKFTLQAQNGTQYAEMPPGPGNGANFFVPAGTYTLISDSGCSVPRSYSYSFSMTEVDSTNCSNLASIRVTPNTQATGLCGTYKQVYSFTNSSVTIRDTVAYGSSVYHTNLQPDTYVVRTYLEKLVFNPTTNNYDTTGDFSCALDSMVIIIKEHTQPVLSTQNVTVCGASGISDIPFTISGGLAPYYVNIVGFSNITVTQPFGSLPNMPVGSNYTMIVSDVCGISTSKSVSVIDSCIDCIIVQADFTTTDTLTCVGNTIHFTNSYTNGITYFWTDNGVLFGTTANDSLLVTSGGLHKITCTVRYFNCVDSFSYTFNAGGSGAFNLGPDLFYCDNFTKVLSTAPLAVNWSTGVTDTAITVTTPGLYWASSTGSCGFYSDTVRIDRNFTPLVNLGADTGLCAGDTIVLRATSPTAVSYTWNTGATTDTIVVSTTGSYAVSATNGGCVGSDSIQIQILTFGGDLLQGDTTLCDGDNFVLIPAYGNNPVWQDGSQQAQYTVSTGGTFSVTVTTPCGVYSDSLVVTLDDCYCRMVVPNVFTPNADGHNDRFLPVYQCPPIQSYTMRIYNRWGEKVFETGDYSAGWDGNFKGAPQPGGTFVYYIGYSDPYTGNKHGMQGSVTLLR